MTNLRTYIRVKKEPEFERNKDYYLILYRFEKNRSEIQRIIEEANLKVADLIFTPVKVKP